METTSSHPDGPRLMALATGEPPDEAIAAHLRNCRKCCDRLMEYRAELLAIRGLDGAWRSNPVLPESILDLGEQQELDAIREEFEAKLQAGLSTPIEDYCIENENLGPRLLVDLIGLELEYRWRQDSSFRPDPEEYERRFPSHRKEIDQAIAIFARSGRMASQRWVGGYELLEELGRGGQGVVYRARRPGLECAEHLVALKLILPALLASTEHVGRFVREIRAISELNHRGIIPTFDSGEDRGQPYVAMKLVVRSLDQVLRERGRMPPDEAVRLAIEMARAVDHFHRHGYIHCDLKPSNVLLDGDQPLITDFGLARVLGPDADLGTIEGRRLEGTIPYMSPEQLRGEPCRASDIYSLGAILFKMLTGRTPYGSGWRALLGISHSEGRAPRFYTPAIPSALDAIVRKCLRQEPSTRYESAGQLADELDRLRIGEPLIDTPAETFVETLIRWVSLHRELSTRLIALGAILALTQFNYFVVLRDRGPNPRLHISVTVVESVWIAASIVLDRLSRAWGSGPILRALWLAMDVALLTILLGLLEAATTTAVLGYPLLIAISGLWVRPWLVWQTTALCVAGYIGLVFSYKLQGLPWTTGTKEDDPNIALVLMIVTGHVVALQLRRTCAALKACQSRQAHDGTRPDQNFGKIPTSRA